MIISKDTNPKRQVYYLSAKILYELKLIEDTEFDFFNLYRSLQAEEDISINLYSLALDWLFLLGAIKKESNRLIKCF